MIMRGWSIGFIFALAAALGGCDTAPPTSQPAEVEEVVAEQPVMGPERHILAFGNSLFAGYRVDPDESYPSRLQAALRARGVNAQVTSAAVSGNTTAAGLERLEFTLDAQEQTPDLAIVELGGNDFLRGLPVAQTRENLSQILEILRERDIPVLLMGMRAPPNLGADYVAAFDGMFGELAQEYDAALVPFWLESIYRRPELFQSDRVHPTAEGIELLVDDTADDVAEALPAPEG